GTTVNNVEQRGLGVNNINMKFLIVLSAVLGVALSSSGLPLSPAQEEALRRQLLQQEQRPAAARDGSKNEYWLYTRRNPTVPQFLLEGDERALNSSHYSRGADLRVVVHGLNNNGNAAVNVLLTEAFLQVGDVNVVVVDWRDAANRDYVQAALGVGPAGRALGNFLQWLLDATGTPPTRVHIAGHSLGAHVSGFAGRTLRQRVARITGMDPAGPSWRLNPLALNREDARYVEAIHTDGNILGIFDPIGHANFYPNGGMNPQPGCLISTCSHSRSYQLMAASVKLNHLVARECGSLLAVPLGLCGGPVRRLGNDDLDKDE
ncbi:hypothetical protein JYU34_010540, partial [Plutella xylostella]